MSQREVYSVCVQMIIQIENVSWNRLYNFLMANSILILAWATIYVSSQKGFWCTAVLVVIATVGIGAGVMFSELGGRARAQLEGFYTLAVSIEADPGCWAKLLLPLQLPFTMNSCSRKTGSFYSKNPFILSRMPLAFSAISSVMLVATFLR